MSEGPLHISSRDNPQFKALKRLAQDPAAYRRQGQVWLEGEHLCRAALARGWRPAMLVLSEEKRPEDGVDWTKFAPKTVVFSDELFAQISPLESPSRLAFVLDLPAPAAAQAGLATVVLDRLQDAGNVGSILRSASAFGFRQVIALKRTAALWSPKVLRAGMGAHFGLQLLEVQSPEVLDGLGLPLVVTSSHQGQFLHQKAPPFPCAFVLGHEGQGVDAALMERAAWSVRIAQPGGEESLNVAAAAAICLHACASQTL